MSIDGLWTFLKKPNRSLDTKILAAQSKSFNSESRFYIPTVFLFIFNLKGLCLCLCICPPRHGLAPLLAP